MTVIKPSKAPRASTAREYVRYFTKLAAEYNARAERLEARVLAGRTIKGSPDYTASTRPSTELEDILCFTRIRRCELERVLPLLFDAYRRASRARHVAVRAQHIPRQRRLELVAGGLEQVLDGELYDPRFDVSTENEIDYWLDSMTGQCTWSAKDHWGAPVPEACPLALLRFRRRPFNAALGRKGAPLGTPSERRERIYDHSHPYIQGELIMNTNPNTITAALHDWAAGNTCLSAAVDLLAGFSTDTCSTAPGSAVTTLAAAGSMPTPPTLNLATSAAGSTGYSLSP